MHDGKEIIGNIERVWLPDLLDDDHKGIQAKIDTGAVSGALHCEHIKLIKGEDKKKYVQFQPLNKRHKMVKVRKFDRVRTKSSNGEVEKRFRIKTKIKIRGKVYPIKFTLTDRTDMKYNIILGSRFLKNKFLVDVSK